MMAPKICKKAKQKPKAKQRNVRIPKNKTSNVHIFQENNKQFTSNHRPQQREHQEIKEIATVEIAFLNTSSAGLKQGLLLKKGKTAMHGKAGSLRRNVSLLMLRHAAMNSWRSTGKQEASHSSLA